MYVWKNLIDVFMKYLCMHHIVKLRVFAIEMYDVFLSFL